MNIYELTARFDPRKSFYGKAKVIEHDNGNRQLLSYDTIVAEIDKNGEFSLLWNGNTQTTSRHIKEFRRQFERYNNV